MTAASGKAEGGDERELLRECDAVLSSLWHLKMNPDLRNAVNDLMARITAHLATAAANGPGEADGWLPIDSAPADTPLLLAWLNTWPVTVWEQEVAMAHITRAGTWHGRATHWRPLPAPPGAAESTPQPGMVTVPREPTEAELYAWLIRQSGLVWKGIAVAIDKDKAARSDYRRAIDTALRSGGRETEVKS